jgi:hypothetical protein
MPWWRREPERGVPAGTWRLFEVRREVQQAVDATKPIDGVKPAIE